MIRKITALSVLALVLAAGSFLGGCQTSTAQPNSVTGMTDAQKLHYTDDKGRFHSDLAAAERPLR